ncbi:MAG: Ig-like domain-containing protein [Pseudomonadota bacterium]
MVQIPALVLSKSAATLTTDADASGDITQGDTLSYTVTLTNTGDVALTNVVVNDAQLTPGSTTCASVAVGGTCFLSGTHVVTAGEAQAGEVVNTASATSTEVPGPTDSNTVTTPVVQIPALTLAKSAAALTTDADASGDITEGDTLSYTVTLTNTGDVPLTNVVVSDPQLTPGSTTCANVAVGGTCVLSGTHVVTAGEAQAGEVVNTANATSTEVPGPTDSNTVTTPVIQIPALTLAKSAATLTTDADASGNITEGDTLSYTVTLTNTGDVALTNVIVNDPQLTPVSTTCANVAIGGTCVLTGTHVVTALEAQAGQVVNTANATSTEVPGPTDSNTVTTPVVQIPALTLSKSAAALTTDADASGDITEGDTLSYTVTLTNTGDVALTNVIVGDAQLTPGSTTCANVAVGGTCVLSGTHVVTAGEAQAGEVVNTANATSTEVPGPTDSNTVTTPVVQVPALTLAKSAATLTTDADASSDITEGDTLSYTVTLTNTGDVALTNVIVNDAQLTPASTTCASVAVGGTCVLTGTHVVTALEAQAGQVVNTANATSTEVPGPTDSNTVTTPVVLVPALTLAKSDASLTTEADAISVITEGDTLSYTVTLTNTGDVALTTVIVNDAQLTPASATCANVAVGGTCVLSGTHVVTAGEAQAGEVVNTANATSTEVPGPTDSNTVTTPVIQIPALTLAKSAATLTTDADASGDITEGDTLSYTVTLTNTGDVPLTNVAINDPQLTPASTTCASVAVGGTCVLSGTHVVSNAEALAGQVVNTANATSTEVPGPTDSNTVTTPVVQIPALSLVKSVATLTTDADASGNITEGDTLSYTVTLTNVGDVPLTNVVVSDPQLTPGSTTCASVAIGGTCVLTGTHVVTALEAQAGQVVNTANATSTEVPGPTNSNTVTTPVVQVPALTLDKSVATLVTDADASGDITEGDTLGYTVTLTNTGDVPLTNVVVNDPQLTPGSTTCASVAVGGTCVLSGTHVVTAAEAQAGEVVNTANATSTEVPGPTSSNTVTTPVVQIPSLTLAKSAATLTTDADASGDITEGDTLSYTVTLTNTGDVALTNVIVNDPQLTPASTTCANVAIGETCILSGTHVVTAGEAQAGEVVNTANATSTEVPGPTDSNTVTTPVVQVPALTLDKSVATLVTDADASGDITEGDTLGYTVTLTNIGDVPLTNVIVSDPQLTPASTTCASVAVGGTCVLSGTHVVSNAEALAGEVVNTASVTSAEVPGPTSSNTVTTPVRPVPGFTLSKSDASLAVDADGSGSLTGGDTLSYTVTLTNTGNLPLTNVVVSDPQLTPGSTSCANVPLGGTCVLTGTHVVTDAEVRARRVVNTATATSAEIPAPVSSNTVTTPVANRRPVAITDTYTTPAGVPVALFPLNADSDPDGDTLYVFSINGVPLTPGAYQEIPVTGGTVIVAADGSFSFVPDPGFTGTVTFPYAITDRNGGIASANQIITVTSPDVAEATLVKSPATLLVDADASGDVSLGDTLAYTITLTNTGTVELTNVVVTDALLDPGSISCAVVAVADTCVLEGTHVVTLDEAQAGEVVNTANAVSEQTPAPAPSNTVVTPVAPVPAGVPAMVTTKPEPVLATDADGDGLVSAGDTLAYTVTVTNTGETPLTEVRIDDAMLTPDSVTCALVLVGETCVLEGTYVVTMADVEAGALTNTATASSAQVCLPGETPAAGCTASVGIDIEQRPQISIEKLAELTTDEGVQGRGEAGDVITYSVIVTNTGNLTISDLVVEDSFQGGAPVLLDCTPTTLAPGEVATCASYTHTITAAEANAGIPLENAVIATGTTKSGTQTITVTGNAAAVVEVQADPTVIRLSKSAQPSEVRVGDLVRYQVRVENTGGGPLVDGLLVDTPPAGFTYVQDSLVVADDDGVGRLVGTFPIRVDRIDVAPGQSATISYLLRVGAGVRPGVHVNSAVLTSDGSQSNVATAQVRLVGDPMLEDSLVLGTVFDDRDGDGRQDLAALTGVRLQGGFDAASYVAGSTVLHRDGKFGPVADASAPLLRGLDVGDIAGRQSEADPAPARQVVVSQLLAEPRFTDDFVLSNDQGLSLRMDAAGNTRLEGEPAQNTAAMPRVERRVSREADGYRVDYVVSNVGIQERGIPGVRIASVEGLLVETDPFGRYHLVGVAGGPWERGRNFILKVDTATLPPGSVATTRNPLVRRVTQGIPTRFDFGFTLPGGRIAGAGQVLEIELGSLMFPPDSAELRPGHEPVVAGIVEQLQGRDAGELVITAEGGDEALAFRRARAVQQAVEAAMPEGLGDVMVSLRNDAADPGSSLASIGTSPVLGTVLFETGQAVVAPRYAALLDAVAADIEQRAARADGALVVGIVGHADRRGSDQANTALGLRRARAVFDALAARLPPELRQRLRVDISQDPDAPVLNAEGGE